MSAVVPDAISIRRSGRSPLTIHPIFVDLDAAAFGVPVTMRAGLFRVLPVAGWSVEPVSFLCWRLSANEIDLDSPVQVVLQHLSPAGEVQEWSLSIPVELDLRSTFDPIAHTFPEPNRASVLGDILPERALFERTYVQPRALFSNALFQGLYSDIVFLRRDGPTRGGLCSGMARWAIARGIGVEPEPSGREQALERIVTFHGRQLTDRAFSLGIGWFLRGSPRAAYRAFRRDLVQAGSSDRAFDVGVPKPWRKDVVSALVTQGHTIVPYRIRQTSSAQAFVEVYDPNRPPATLDVPEEIEFDLAHDRYRYRHMVSMDQDNVGIIAARQSGYARRGTAIAASIASLTMRFGKWMAEIRKSVS